MEECIDEADLVQATTRNSPADVDDQAWEDIRFNNDSEDPIVIVGLGE